MDPISLAVMTSAVTTLATKAVEGFGGEAGKTLWGRVKSALGWTSEPPTQDLPVRVAEELSRNHDLAKRVLALLNEREGVDAGVQQLVGRIDASKVVVVETMHVTGDFKM